MIIIKNNKIWLAVLGIVSIFLLTLSVNAQTLTQGYGADSVLQVGMIVGLKKDDPRMVEPISSADAAHIQGVVVSANDSAVLLGNDNEKVYVASGGRFKVLVSNQNGDIKNGDYVSVSSIDGIGKASSPDDPIVLGKAISGYQGSDTNQVISTAKVKNASGNEVQLSLGYVIVDISIGKNPLAKTENNLPVFLSKAGETIAGKPVSATKVYISLALMFLTTAVAASLLYAGVRNSMIAIGRNPLSRKLIIRGLFQVVFIGLIVFLCGVFGVYLLLKL
jgi:hypothetical protein